VFSLLGRRRAVTPRAGHRGLAPRRALVQAQLAFVADIILVELTKRLRRKCSAFFAGAWGLDDRQGTKLNGTDGHLLGHPIGATAYGILAI